MIDPGAVAVEGVGYPAITLATRGWISEIALPTGPVLSTSVGALVTLGGSQYLVFTIDGARAAGLDLSGGASLSATLGALGFRSSAVAAGSAGLLAFSVDGSGTVVATAGGSDAGVTDGGSKASIS